MAESASGEASSANSHGGKDSSEWRCRQCGKPYSSRQGLKYHYKSDNVDCEGYECPQCNQSIFLSEFGVSRHYGKSHEGSYTEYPQLTDKQWFHQKYTVEGYNTYEIADLVGCSQAVANEWRNKHGIANKTEYKSRGLGENNPNYKAGSPDRTTHYGNGWSKARRLARERDNHRCQRCGKGPDALNMKVDVHHIIPVHRFDEPQSAHELDNLVCLCRSCHRKWEGIPLQPDRRHE